MNIALVGYGKMGKIIEEVALSRGHQVGIKIDINNLDEFNADNFATIDAAIEFTGPHTALQNVLKCLDVKTPVVCGSTGWLEQLSAVEEKCAQTDGSFLYASNFSVGVNIFF
jgi:4-hydroxy-tetrahydrodipicolinate reductase